MLSREQMISIYSKMLFSHSSGISSHNPQLIYLRYFLPENRDRVILDAACGNGRYAFTLCQDGYRKVLAFDLFKKVNTQDLFEYFCGSMDTIALTDSSIDFLYCFSAIYYLPNPFDGFREFYRVMKPGAILIVSSHTKYSLFTIDRVVKRYFGKSEHLAGVKFYSTRQYSRMLESSGFNILDVDGYELLYSPGDILNKINKRLNKYLPTSRFVNQNKLKCVKASQSKNASNWLKYIRSTIGYHLLIAARKPLT